MAEKRSVIRIDDNLSKVFNVRLSGEYENGFIGKLGDWEQDNLDVRALLPALSGNNFVIIGNDAIVYDNNRPTTGLETNYYMKSGEVVRAYVPEVGKKISVSLEGFDGDAPVAGSIVTTNGAKQLKVVAQEPAQGTYFKVVKLEQVAGVASLNMNGNGHKVTYAILDTVRV